MSTIAGFTTTDVVRAHRHDLERLGSPRGSKPRLTARLARARRAR